MSEVEPQEASYLLVEEAEKNQKGGRKGRREKLGGGDEGRWSLKKIWELTQKPTQPQSEPRRWGQGRKREKRELDGGKHGLCYDQGMELKTPWNWLKN